MSSRLYREPWSLGGIRTDLRFAGRPIVDADGRTIPIFVQHENAEAGKCIGRILTTVNACTDIEQRELTQVDTIPNARQRLLRLGFLADRIVAEIEGDSGARDLLTYLRHSVEEVCGSLVLAQPTDAERAELERLVAQLQDVLRGPVPERAAAGEFAPVAAEAGCAR